MWEIVYNILVHISLPLFVFFSIFKKKLRKNLNEKLLSSTKSHPVKDAIWIHAASIGEAAIAETLIKFMEQQKKLNFPYLLTTNTYYTRELLLKKMGKNVHTFFLPVDVPYIIRHFIDGSTFKALILVETEIWPNLIWTAKKYNIPVIILNGRISDKTFPNYKRFSFFLKHVLSEINTVITQSEEHKNRFIAIGADPERIITTGNIKYYREIPLSTLSIKENILTFGSIKEKELDAVFYVIRKLKDDMPDIKIFVAPRELHLSSKIEDEMKKDYKTVRYSTIKKEKDPQTLSDMEIIVVDTVGDLLDIYRKSKIAFVGGSLAPYGGQNILEPLFFETPVLFGPYVENFKEIVDLILEKKAGIMVRDKEDLFFSIKHLLDNPSKALEIGKRGKEIIEMHKNYMEKTVDIIIDVVKKKEG
ncbi:MAG TPA: glycosyltransferase N-terminal domain-containing protein [Syntrophorhabdaceae bacterium]|nr:glycosyltransferase N-terminal domain-containing protein [Syntrophorhabdaceae bacterium]